MRCLHRVASHNALVGLARVAGLAGRPVGAHSKGILSKARRSSAQEPLGFLFRNSARRTLGILQLFFLERTDLDLFIERMLRQHLCS